MFLNEFVLKSSDVNANRLKAKSLSPEVCVPKSGVIGSAQYPPSLRVFTC